jgi:TRAP-type C4-dicarboxylate transport system permease small subunit
LGATISSVSSTDSARTIERYLRLAFAALLGWLTWIAFHNEYGNVPIVTDVSTAIHEFGHMLFMPFGIPILGRTMVILGGSLTEVAFPLLFVGYFLRKREDSRRRDVFAAMVCLWWSGIGLLGTAIYCADSRAGKLVLLDGLTGQESDGHDWYNLLDRWGLLEHDTQIARWMRMIAWLMCVGSIAAAVWSALQLPREQPVVLDS